jgi:deoxyribodipyrimidine photo-lyase
MSNTSLFLFRNDLRLQDNQALTAALNSGQAVILLYIFDESSKEKRTIGSASQWWLHLSLISLSNNIKKLGGKLILRKGQTIEILDDIINQADVNKLYFSRTYEPELRKIEESIYSKWHEQIQIKRYGGYLLFEPEQIRTGSDGPYKVFTPFWKACLKQHEPLLSEDKQKKKINFSSIKINSDQLDDWNLLPTKPDWANGLRENWQPGEDSANKALNEFIATALENYEEDRNRPDRSGTSHLSPYLHFGEISPVRIWHEVKQHLKKNSHDTQNGMSYLRELGWRDFSAHLLYHWPDLPEKPFRDEYKAFPWKKNKKALTAWQNGLTGFPIIDAGMRELWHCGWMHNRVRMIVASFLVKHLLIHWREGEAWFWDTLVDADLANNAASWQWVAGSGADAAPYFRIFNPILQGKKFDPNGDYVRRWIPELKQVSTKYIHEPWLAPKDMLNQNEPQYPEPIIEHSEGRKRALEAYSLFKNNG